MKKLSDTARAFVLAFGFGAAVLFAAAAAHANAPAPWWACEGKQAGEACSPYGGGSGECDLQANCTDEPGTDVNECLVCESTSSGNGDDCSAASPASSALAALLAALFVATRRRFRDYRS